MEQLNLFSDPDPSGACRRKHTPAACDASIVSRRDRLCKRNRLLTARYYYWTELRRRRFDDVVKILSDNEFFVEDRTISNTLMEQDAFYKELCRDKANRQKLRKMFPGFDWD